MRVPTTLLVLLLLHYKHLQGLLLVSLGCRYHHNTQVAGRGTSTQGNCYWRLDTRGPGEGSEAPGERYPGSGGRRRKELTPKSCKPGTEFTVEQLLFHRLVMNDTTRRDTERLKNQGTLLDYVTNRTKIREKRYPRGRGIPVSGTDRTSVDVEDTGLVTERGSSLPTYN